MGEGRWKGERGEGRGEGREKGRRKGRGQFKWRQKEGGGQKGRVERERKRKVIFLHQNQNNGINILRVHVPPFAGFP